MHSTNDLGESIKRKETDYAIPNSPSFNWLVMSTRTNRNGLRDLLTNRKKNLKAKSDVFLDGLVDPASLDMPVNVAVVDIVAVNPLDSFNGIFHISLHMKLMIISVQIDGRIFGPFKRIVIQPCKVSIHCILVFL
jgi:hypothetical protein